jgi:hypothetical protein
LLASWLGLQYRTGVCNAFWEAVLIVAPANAAAYFISQRLSIIGRFFRLNLSMRRKWIL